MVVGLSGGVILVVYLIERLRGHAMDNGWYVLLFVVLFILGASFMVWKDEHGKVAVLTIKLEKQKAPKLDARFDVSVVAPAGEKNESSMVIISANIYV